MIIRAVLNRAGHLATLKLTVGWLLWLGLAQSMLAHEPPITASEREHWSFAPLVTPQIPATSSHKVLGPIDALIAANLAKEQLDLAPQAEPAHLLRRLTFDLTGLPPSFETSERFQANANLPDAYEREVDRLLASPAVGEHLAQRWLDLARYAETDGFEHDKVRPDAWRYRDWVISAINNDLPYDRFVHLQIAGDLLSDDAAMPVATMFCLSGPDMPDLNDQAERRHNLLNEMTGTVGSVILGLQLGCAACHDHKTDPISQADFYRLRGVLASGVAMLQRDQPWTLMVEQPTLEPARFYHRGDHRQATETLELGVPRIAADAQFNLLVAASVHPRRELAEWLTNPANPLPARAEANRMWQDHFGVGISSTPGDLGLMGDGPSSPELLDYLAVALQQHAWSRQWLRRQIVLSATYRAASQGSSQAPATTDWAERLQRDPGNRLFSRYPRRRLTGEMLRDAMLQVAGLSNRQQGGESVMPPLPDELRSALLPGQWKTSAHPAEHARRSVYVFGRRNLRYPIFESFDRPDAGASCARRGNSTTATQALLMYNSEFTLQIATAVAQRLQIEDQRQAGDGLWQMVLARSPIAAERELLDELLSSFDDRAQGLTAAALALLNCNEFITID